MSTTASLCKAFGKIICTPCLIIYWLITGADKEEEQEALIVAPAVPVAQPETIKVEPSSSNKVDYGTNKDSERRPSANRSTMLWDYSDIIIDEPVKPANNLKATAILEEPEDDEDEKVTVRKLPKTIGSAFVKPDKKEIEEAFKKIVQKDVIENLIEAEAVKDEEHDVEIRKKDSLTKVDGSGYAKPEYKDINWEKPKETIKNVQSFLDTEKY